MSEAREPWDGLPQNPERDGWHWLRTFDGRVVPIWWRATPCAEYRTPFWQPRSDPYYPHQAAAACYSYLGPCLPPDLTSLSLPDRLAMLLTSEERAEVAVVPRVATEAMQIAGHCVRTQHLDSKPPSGTDEIYAAMIAASEAAKP